MHPFLVIVLDPCQRDHLGKEICTRSTSSDRRLTNLIHQQYKRVQWRKRCEWGSPLSLRSRITLFLARHAYDPDVRGSGRYWGPLVFIAIDFEPPKSFCDLYEVEIWRRKRVDTVVVDAQIRERPFTGGDGRERTKTIQWSKIHAFDPDFGRRWQHAVFLDAGPRIFHSLDPIFAHPWKGSIVALDDSHPNDTKRFGCRLETNLID